MGSSPTLIAYGGLAELVDCTGLENQQTETSQRFESFSLRKKELWQTWCMRKTENLENVVRLHEVPLNDTIPYGIAKWSL